MEVTNRAVGSATALRSDSELTLLRVPSKDGTRLAFLFNQEDEIASRRRFENEYRAFHRRKKGGHSPSLEIIDAKQALVTFDPGGSPIKDTWKVDSPVTEFLAAARSLSESLDEIHSLGLVHGDIRPENILCAGPGEFHFIGFGQSFIGADGTPEGFAKNLHPVQLPYCSPEHTGRVDRGVDARSDLYSFGVVLYELLTGHLPFSAKTPSDWIHSHLARPALPPGRWVTSIPSMVAAIIMKLLSKQSEERYQSAVGLASDLSRCLTELGGEGRVDFDLGTKDSRGSLIIPQRLYGRAVQLAFLADALDAVTESGSSKAILLAGSAGVGKSALVRAFQNSLDVRSCLFSQGKFDQLNYTSPYSTLVSALREMVREVIAQPSPIRDETADRMKQSFAHNGRLLTTMIPELVDLVGEQPELLAIPAAEIQNRFHTVLIRFIRVFATRARPLVFFFDDWQWIDQATLSFVDRVVADRAIPNLLIIGAFRDNEVDGGHPVRLWIEEKKDLLAVMQLGRLDLAQVVDLVADSLGSPRAEIIELAKVVEEKAEGNPLFTIQLLTSLADAGLLSFDSVVRKWVWQFNAVNSLSAENVSDLIAWRLGRVSVHTREMLATMALIGNSVVRQDITTILGVELADAAIEEAVTSGLISQNGDELSFLHDRIQEGAYALMPASQRPRHHLEMARKMLSNFTGDVNDHLFEIVQQFSHGVDLIDSDDEKIAIAKLSLVAGKKAEQSSAFGAAADYYRIGERLTKDLWGDYEDDFFFELAIRIADCELLIGETSAAEQRLGSLRRAVQGVTKRAKVTWSEITLFTALGQFERAINLCLNFLLEVGVDWQPKPEWQLVQSEFAPIAEEIREGAIQSRRELPKCTGVSELILEVLSAALPPAFFFDENLVCLILCRMANISRQHGNSGSSALGYAYLGMVLGPDFGDYTAGFEFGRLGMALAEDPDYWRFQGRVAMTFAYHVQPYSKPIRSTRDLHRRALEISLETGDLTYAGFCTCTTISNLLFSGDNLSVVEMRASAGVDYARQIKFGLIADIVTSQLMLVRSLRGSTLALGSFDDGAFSEEEFGRRLDQTPGLQIAACWHWTRKLQAAVFSGDFREGVHFAAKAKALLWTTAGHLEFVEFAFYACICLARTFGSARENDLVDVRKYVDLLEVWGNSSPDTFSAHAKAAAAELARVEGRTLEAFKLYDQAIQAGKQQLSPHIEALSAELAADMARELELPSMVQAYGTIAYEAYRQWGANAKLKVLEDRYSYLSTTRLSDMTYVPEQRGIASFDLNAIARSTATVSGEPVQSKMIRALMAIVLENAGARRARLLVPKDGRLRTEADAQAEGDEIVVNLTGTVPLENDFPKEEVWEALSSQTMVSIEYRPDNLLNLRISRLGSALAVPLVSRGRSVGALFLENDLHDGAFPPARKSVIKLIAAQAATALENASLEEKESLLREVHHRVKNNLQLISSLLNLQASYVKDAKTAELFQESRNRVRSMALVHENLYRAGDFARVSMRNHLHTLCNYLMRAYGVQGRQIVLRVEVEDGLDLDLDRAISCGLIVNELVSNALKHAFPHEESGSIRVGLALDNKSTYRLTVRDDGVGMPDNYKQRGSLGLQLIHDLVDQLRGSLDIRRDDGTSIEIRFVAASD